MGNHGIDNHSSRAKLNGFLKSNPSLVGTRSENILVRVFGEEEVKKFKG